MAGRNTTFIVMNFFRDCETIDEAKNLFRKLCKKMHPDVGGNASEFIKMYKEFENFRPRKKHTGEAADHNDTFNAEQFYNIVQKFEGLNDIEINFVGSFIWLEGNTFAMKEQIKAIVLEGYKPVSWAKNKKAWFFSPLDYSQKGRSNKGLEELKSTYGCTSFKSHGFAQLQH